MKKLAYIWAVALALLGLSAVPARAADALPASVTFELNKSELSAEALKAIGAAADQAKSTAGARVLVSGFTDTSGSAALNDELAKKRASAVRDALIKAGLPGTQILLIKPSARMKAIGKGAAHQISL
jgi:cytochrome c oxidase subunit 2